MKHQVKKAAILGGGGFIGSNLENHLKNKGYYVVSVDLKLNEFVASVADEFHKIDLRNPYLVSDFFKSNKFDEVYQLAADMGGAGYIFTGNNDADIMSNSAKINLNVLDSLKHSDTKVFFSSSACIYPIENQLDAKHPNCAEHTAIPANPDSEYGWEKLFSERLYLSYHRNYNLNIRIARFHNVFGKNNKFQGGKEKAPAAICRKVILAKDNSHIEIWGNGQQTRSFLHINECLEGIDRLMESTYVNPINIGSEEMITVSELASKLIKISGKSLELKSIDGPVGVTGRCSDNNLIQKVLNWKPQKSIDDGLVDLYGWTLDQMENGSNKLFN